MVVDACYTRGAEEIITAEGGLKEENVGFAEHLLGGAVQKPWWIY